MLFSLYVSMTDYNGVNLGGMTWLGMGNYAAILRDGAFWKSFGVTLYAALGVPLGLAVSTAVSMLLVSVTRGQGFYKAALFIPNVCSAVAVTMIWKWMFNYEFGVVNNALFGLFGKKVTWLESADVVMWVYIAMGMWTSLGYNIIMLIAALLHVDESLYEAASMVATSLKTLSDSYGEYLESSHPAHRRRTACLGGRRLRVRQD